MDYFNNYLNPDKNKMTILSPFITLLIVAKVHNIVANQVIF